MPTAPESPLLGFLAGFQQAQAKQREQALDRAAAIKDEYTKRFEEQRIKLEEQAQQNQKEETLARIQQMKDTAASLAKYREEQQNLGWARLFNNMSQFDTKTRGRIQELLAKGNTQALQQIMRQADTLFAAGGMTYGDAIKTATDAILTVQGVVGPAASPAQSPAAPTAPAQPGTAPPQSAVNMFLQSQGQAPQAPPPGTPSVLQPLDAFITRNPELINPKALAQIASAQASVKAKEADAELKRIQAKTLGTLNNDKHALNQSKLLTDRYERDLKKAETDYTVTRNRLVSVQIKRQQFAYEEEQKLKPYYEEFKKAQSERAKRQVKENSHAVTEIHNLRVERKSVLDDMAKVHALLNAKTALRDAKLDGSDPLMSSFQGGAQAAIDDLKQTLSTLQANYDDLDRQIKQLAPIADYGVQVTDKSGKPDTKATNANTSRQAAEARQAEQRRQLNQLPSKSGIKNTPSPAPKKDLRKKRPTAEDLYKKFGL